MKKSASFVILISLIFFSSQVLGMCAEEATPREAGFDSHELWFGRWSEGGVATRLLTDYFGNFRLSPIFSIEVGASLSLLEHAGPSLLGFLGKISFPNAESQLVFGFQHERWASWQVTENRLEFYWKFFPAEKFNLSFGLAYRTPQYGSITVIPFSYWSSIPNGEVSILYSADWRLFQFDPLGFSLLIWDYDHMRLFTMDNTHFTLKMDWAVRSSFRVFLAATLGVNGVSGGILSLNQSIFSTGFSYEL